MSGSRQSAERLSDLTLELLAQVEDAARRARSELDMAHHYPFCELAAQIQTELLTAILVPIYQTYPELKPPELA